MSILQGRAREIVDELAAHGAVFTYRPAANSLPASFTYELAGGGDRQACRSAIARARGDAALWHAIVDEIGERRRQGAA